MGQFSELDGNSIMREWLQKLCSKGITVMNLGHDPGYRGLLAVTRHLGEKTDSLPYDDCVDNLARQVYMAFFLPSSTWTYITLSEFLRMKAISVDWSYDHARGFTFDISAYATVGFIRCDLPGASDLAEELAEVFAKAYNGNSPSGSSSGELFVIG